METSHLNFSLGIIGESGRKNAFVSAPDRDKCIRVIKGKGFSAIVEANLIKRLMKRPSSTYGHFMKNLSKYAAKIIKRQL